MKKIILLLALLGRIELSAQTTKSQELHPSWSPDGEWLTFHSDKNGNEDIYAYHLNENDVVQLTSNDSSDTGPVWSNDGAFIVFESLRNGNSDLYMVHWESFRLFEVATAPYDEIQPTFGMDGSVFFSAYVQENWQLFKVDTKSQAEQISFEAQDHLSPAPGTRERELYYSISAPDLHQTDVEIMLWDFESGTQTEITKDSGVSSNASTHKDAEWIVFNTKRNGNWDLYKMRKDGAEPISITSNKGNSSTDFAFTSLDGQPALSPDGKLVAFISGRAGSFDICLISIDGHDFRNLTEGWVKERDKH